MTKRKENALTRNSAADGLIAIICMSVLLIVRQKMYDGSRRMLVSHAEYADETDRRTDGDQTVTLRFPLYTS